MTARIAILDYGIGNLRSAQKTLERVGADPVLTSDAAEVGAADGVVLPGVGNFGRVMEAIRDVEVDVLAHKAIDAGTPFLGICVGMQALYGASEECPEVDGLGVLDGTVRRMNPNVKLPQMQWNQLSISEPSPLFTGIDDGSWVYFVHSYAPEATADVIATCDYGGTVTAAVQKENVMATQFHPEKSGAVGVQIIANFAALCARRSGSQDFGVGTSTGRVDE
ncbi:MAG: imidazole glycerol phosphate synthase subunit HisH [Acidimicrobiales bacterium]